MPWYKLTVTQESYAYIEADTARIARNNYIDVQNWDHQVISVEADLIPGNPPSGNA